MIPQLSESHQSLHSFCLAPKIRFETQFVDENVVLVLRAHPVTQIPWIFNALVFSILLLLGNFILPNYLNSKQIVFTNIFGLGIILSYIWFNFLVWFFNVGIITDKRIIDVDFDSVIYKEVTEANLDKIEDITAKGGGFFASFFDYGNLFIQTAATEVNIEFINIPHPSEAVKVISNLTHK